MGILGTLDLYQPTDKENWKEARRVMKDLNHGEDIVGDKEQHMRLPDGPLWSFDCGFKLDYDGDLLTVSSRFYGPNKNPVTGRWDGTVSIRSMGDHLLEKEFDCETLDQLHAEVESYVEGIRLKVIDFIRQASQPGTIS